MFLSKLPPCRCCSSCLCFFRRVKCLAHIFSGARLGFSWKGRPLQGRKMNTHMPLCDEQHRSRGRYSPSLLGRAYRGHHSARSDFLMTRLRTWKPFASYLLHFYRIPVRRIAPETVEAKEPRSANGVIRSTENVCFRLLRRLHAAVGRPSSGFQTWSWYGPRRWSNGRSSRKVTSTCGV